MQLMENKMMHNFVVLEHLQDNIIGIDCINLHFLGYRAYKQSSIWETPPIDRGKLKTTERVYLDTLSSKIVKIKCQNDKGGKFGQNTTMIATIKTPHMLIMGPRGISE